MKTLLSLLILAASGASLSSNLAPASPAGASAPSLAPAKFAVDAGHSTVLFRCKHLGISQFWGRFNQVSGEVSYDEAKPAESTIRVVIPSESVDTNSEGRDRHLKSNDFLNAMEFPEIVFESKKIKAKGKAFEVTGELTFHGETQPVVAQAEVIGSGDSPFGDYRLGLEARFTIDMREFGVEFVEKQPGAVGPEVELVVSLECVRQ